MNLETYQAAIREALGATPIFFDKDMDSAHYEDYRYHSEDEFLAALTAAAQSYAQAVATEVIGENFDVLNIWPFPNWQITDKQKFEAAAAEIGNHVKATQRTKLQQILKEAQQ